MVFERAKYEAQVRVPCNVPNHVIAEHPDSAIPLQTSSESLEPVLQPPLAASHDDIRTFRQYINFRKTATKSLVRSCIVATKLSSLNLSKDL